ncbi:unnamed protein product [Urochloa decumbens]|uniref:F-box domain-containing protein n=1 Tax=Urochloa decumbens TaxID=240449 RepID=A0ABC9D8U5_9POAL
MEVAALPGDALAGVLRRLPLRSLAAARCICKAWRDVIDARALLLPHLLPHSVRGIFLNYIDHTRHHFFGRRRSSSSPPPFPEIDGSLGFMPNDDGRILQWSSVFDHCNGLLLFEHEWESGLCVCNPATRQWEVLPRPEEASVYSSLAYLAFDPAVSPHYEVFLIPPEPKTPVPSNHWMLTEHPAEPPYHLMEWPPSPFRLDVFSSRTGQWEGIDFVREGQAAGTVQDKRLDPLDLTMFGGPRWRYAVFHQGALYVHCRGPFVMRLSLSQGKYQVIKFPANIEHGKVYLGKSTHGVCFGIIHESQLRVWILIESCGQMEWVSKYQHNLRKLPSLPNVSGKFMGGPWVIEEDNNIGESEESREWDSDNDDLFTVEVEDNENEIEDEEYHHDNFYILGFHPYKEVVFLVQQFEVLAYHLDSSKIQYMENCRPKCYTLNHSNAYESFLYTPCVIGRLLHGDNTDQNPSED